MPSYVALMRKDPDSDFSVDFPDFPGCVTAGGTPEEARRMAAEALAFHIDGMREDGLPLPEPQGLARALADPENADAFAFVVDVDFPHASALVDVHVDLTEDELRAIDAWARRHGVSRAAALAEAARRMVAEEG